MSVAIPGFWFPRPRPLWRPRPIVRPIPLRRRRGPHHRRCCPLFAAITAGDTALNDDGDTLLDDNGDEMQECCCDGCGYCAGLTIPTMALTIASATLCNNANYNLSGSINGTWCLTRGSLVIIDSVCAWELDIAPLVVTGTYKIGSTTLTVNYNYVVVNMSSPTNSIARFFVSETPPTSPSMLQVFSAQDPATTCTGARSGSNQYTACTEPPFSTLRPSYGGSAVWVFQGC